MSRRKQGKSHSYQASGSSGPLRWVYSVANHLIVRILNWPRIIRIIISGLFALAVTGATFGLVDVIYLRYFFSSGTVIVPGMISAGLGLVMYLVGWHLIVGTVGEAAEAQIPILWYFLLGVLAIALDAIWILQGIYVGTLPT